MRRGLLLAALLCGGCAPSLRVLAGEAEGASVAPAATLRATAQATIRRGGGAAVALSIENAGGEPVGIEVDAIVLRDAAGRTRKALGRAQRFTGAAGEEVRRVPHGATVVEPHATAKVAVEFDGVASAVTAELALPSLYQLGLDGQKALPALAVPLALDRAATKAAYRAAYPDPFVAE